MELMPPVTMLTGLIVVRAISDRLCSVPLTTVWLRASQTLYELSPPLWLRASQTLYDLVTRRQARTPWMSVVVPLLPLAAGAPTQALRLGSYSGPLGIHSRLKVTLTALVTTAGTSYSFTTSMPLFSPQTILALKNTTVRGTGLCAPSFTTERAWSPCSSWISPVPASA